jgi:hypothetical protein
LLIEEIERLHVDLWSATTTREHMPPPSGEADDQVQTENDRTLRARLNRVLDRSSRAAS